MSNQARWHLTPEEQKTIADFVAQAAPGLTVTMSAAVGSHQNCMVLKDSAGEPVMTIGSHNQSGRLSYHSKFWGYEAKGRFIPRQGNQTYGEGWRRLKSLPDLLRAVAAYMRSENEFELARAATEKARGVLGRALHARMVAKLGSTGAAFDASREQGEDRAALAALDAYAFDRVPLDDDVTGYLKERVQQIRVNTEHAAAESAMLEMWWHFDNRRPGGPKAEDV